MNAALQAIDNPDGITASQHCVSDMRANKTGSSCDQGFHRRFSPD
jgi:hypothetical protein